MKQKNNLDMPTIDDIRKNDELVELFATIKTDLLTPILVKVTI